MDVTKPYKFIRFGAMDVTKPYEFIGFGAHANRFRLSIITPPDGHGSVVHDDVPDVPQYRCLRNKRPSELYELIGNTNYNFNFGFWQVSGRTWPKTPLNGPGSKNGAEITQN